MVKQQRRIFLKVIATGPLVGCADADPESPSSGGAGSEPKPGGGSGPAGSSFASGGDTGGSPFFSGGTGTGSAGRFGDVAGSPVASGASSGGMGGGTANPGTPVGNVSSFPIGSFSIVVGLFFLGHDADGLYAMSMQCTHKFCALTSAGNELDCPCHKSRFDRSGNVLQGPAETPLPHYAVFVDAAGSISVDKYTVVSSSVRTPV